MKMRMKMMAIVNRTATGGATQHFPHNTFSGGEK
jgi:hypothetical protein